MTWGIILGLRQNKGNPQGSNPATQTATLPAPSTPQGLPKRACCPPSRHSPAPARQAPRCGSAPLPQPAHALVPQSSQQNSNPATQTAPTGSPRASLPPQEGLLPAARQLALLMEHFMGFFSCGFFSCVQVISSMYPPSSHYFSILCCLCCRYHTVWRLDGCLRVP
jgi:hypothetical protein